MLLDEIKEMQKHYNVYHFISTWTTFNCSMFEEDEMKLLSKYFANQIVGILYGLVGLFYIICYVPCFLAMLHNDHFQFPCFKIMAFVALLEIIILIILGPITGYFTYYGIVACLYPVLNMICGVIIFSLFSTVSAATILLLSIRLIEYKHKKIVSLLFGGRKVYFWMFLTLIYGFGFSIFTKTLTFCAPAQTWSFDLYTGMPSLQNHRADTNLFHQIQALSYVIICAFLYFLYLVIYWREFMKIQTLGANNIKFKLTLQILISSFVSDVTSVLFTLIYYVTVGPAYIITGYFFWLSMHGSTGVILLLFNRSLKNTIKTYVFKVKKNNTIIVKSSGTRQKS